jgi:hypothetical protein
MTLAELLEQAKTLPPHERKELAKLLIDSLDVAPPTRKRRLSELRGLGKDLWQNVDAQTYVNQQRDEWDRRD